MNRPEQKLQIAAVEFLRLALPDCQILHVPNGGKRTKAEAAILKAMGVVAGAPDILIAWGWAHTGMLNGSGWIELKAGGGRLSKAQEDFRDDCRRKGIFWAEARSLDECEQAVRSWGLRPRASVGRHAGKTIIAGITDGLPDLPADTLARPTGDADSARREAAADRRDVPELPGAQAVPMRSALSPTECCKHSVPLRWACDECDNETVGLLYDPFAEEDSQ